MVSESAWMTASCEGIWVRRAQTGDRAAFDELVAPHADALKRFVSKRVPDAQVEDVRQEALLAAWRQIGRYAGRSSFKTWLFSIALNKCRDWQRSREAVPTAEIRDGLKDQAFEQVDLRQDVHRAMSKLDPDQRELLTLYYEDELTLREIADLKDRNLNTLKYQFYRAHQEFARRLGGRYE